MMECGMIRDLFPSYIDGLTSEESNHAIEEHLRECTECQEYLETMKTELASKKYLEMNQAQAKEDIRVFKKLRRRMFNAIFITAAIVMLLCETYELYFIGGVSTMPEDVEITYENVDGVVTIGLIPKKNNIYILGGSQVNLDDPEDGLDETIIPANYHIHPLTIPQQRRGIYLRYVFRDDGTVIYDSTSAGLIELQGDETLTIEFGVKKVSITVNDLRTEKGAEKLRHWLKTAAEELDN